jgi:transposase
MEKKRKSKSKGKGSGMLVTLEADAAGVDIGAEEIYVAVPPDRDESPVRSFGSFTRNLYDLAEWLKQCRIRTVAMESTSVYWIPLYQIFEERGFKVFLVNAQHVRNVPGRKTDVSDCQWIQYLHSVGLLKASFRPPAEICAIRSLWRHRESLVQMAAQHTMHMQKALSQMNVQIHHVLSDITGVSGMAILDAILAGERDPVKLAALCNWRVRSPREVVAQALVGDYRQEHLFTLRQSLQGFRYYQKMIAEVDGELKKLMDELPRAESAADQMPPRTKACIYQRANNEPAFDLPSELYRIAGVDLTDIPGVSANTAQTILSEVGPNVSRFRNASAFASWLGLSPEKQISGGKTLRTKTRKVKNRAAIALRLGASCLYHAKNYFGEFFRRLKFRLGTPQAITATAHKLARVIFHMLQTKEPYSETIFVKCDELATRRAEARLRRQAAQMGYALLPQTPPEGVVL